jgi:hypothetical protein
MDGGGDVIMDGREELLRLEEVEAEGAGEAHPWAFRTGGLMRRRAGTPRGERPLGAATHRLHRIIARANFCASSDYFMVTLNRSVLPLLATPEVDIFPLPVTLA